LGAGTANAALSAGFAGMMNSTMSQLNSGGAFNVGTMLATAGTAALTAGLTNGITFSNGAPGWSWTASKDSLAALAGVQTLGNTLVPQAGAAAGSLPTTITAIAAESVLQATVQTTLQGGSFLTNLRDSAATNAAASIAYTVGNLNQDGKLTGAAYVAAHAALGCAAGAATGQGCGGGAIGAATSAVLSQQIIGVLDPSGAPLDQGQVAMLATLSALTGGGLAGLAGQNAMAGATAAQNEALNNAGQHIGPKNDMLSKACAATNSACSDQMIQTLNNAQLRNDQTAIGQMNTGAPYVAGALGVSLFGVEALTAAATAGLYDYMGDVYSYRTGLSTDKPDFTKSYLVGVFGGLAAPLSIADKAIEGMSKLGKVAATGYNATVAGTAAFGAAGVTHQDNLDIAGGFGAGATALGSAVKMLFPGAIGNFLNQAIQGAAGPLQTAVTQGGSGK